jgi:rifampicin phosphotransferase
VAIDVVQKMVPADAAGVMFTANRVTGERREIVVDGGAGLGEAVAAGTLAEGQRVVVDGGAGTVLAAGADGL